MSVIDWKRPLAGSARIPLAPARFRGTLRRFVDELLEPALPRPQAAIAWHEAIIAHALKPDETLLVRSTSGFKQENETRTAAGRRLRMTDNAPPWWIHAVAFSGASPPATGLSGVLDDVWCWMFRTRSRPGAGTNASDAGWYVAHVLRAKPAGDGPPEGWDETTARRRFIRNISPMNQFLVPKGNGSDVGERATVIATIADWYKARYGAAFTNFLEMAGVRALRARTWEAPPVGGGGAHRQRLAGPGLFRLREGLREDARRRGQPGVLCTRATCRPRPVVPAAHIRKKLMVCLGAALRFRT